MALRNLVMARWQFVFAVATVAGICIIALSYNKHEQVDILLGDGSPVPPKSSPPKESVAASWKKLLSHSKVLAERRRRVADDHESHMSASEEWLKDRPKMENAIKLFHKYGDSALEMLVKHEDTNEKRSNVVEDAQDEIAALGDERNNFKALRFEAESELNLLSRTKRLQAAAKTDKDLLNKASSLARLAMRREEELDSDLSRMVNSVQTLRRRAAEVEEQLETAPVTGDKAAKLMHLDVLLRRDQGAVEGESQAMGEYLVRLRQQLAHTRIAPRRGRDGESSDSDRNLLRYGSARGPAETKIDAAAVARSNARAPADGFDHTESNLKCEPCILGPDCHSGCRLVRLPPGGDE